MKTTFHVSLVLAVLFAFVRLSTAQC